MVLFGRDGVNSPGTRRRFDLSSSRFGAQFLMKEVQKAQVGGGGDSLPCQLWRQCLMSLKAKVLCKMLWCLLFASRRMPWKPTGRQRCQKSGSSVKSLVGWEHSKSLGECSLARIFWKETVPVGTDWFVMLGPLIQQRYFRDQIEWGEQEFRVRFLRPKEWRRGETLARKHRLNWLQYD